MTTNATEKFAEALGFAQESMKSLKAVAVDAQAQGDWRLQKIVNPRIEAMGVAVLGIEDGIKNLNKNVDPKSRIGRARAMIAAL